MKQCAVCGGKVWPDSHVVVIHQVLDTLRERRVCCGSTCARKAVARHGEGDGVATQRATAISQIGRAHV